MGFVGALLAGDDVMCDVSGEEDVDCERTVEAAVHGTGEDLLYYVEDDVVKEIVPGEAEEEGLCSQFALVRAFKVKNKG